MYTFIYTYVCMCTIYIYVYFLAKIFRKSNVLKIECSFDLSLLSNVIYIWGERERDRDRKIKK
jgi:hypothetical protein